MTATRAQLELLGSQNPRRLSLGVQLVPLRVLPAAEVPARLAVTTSPLTPAAPGTLLYLEEVPPGDYRVRVTRTSSGAGELVLGVGRATLPAARWSLGADQMFRVSLPVRASSLSVTGDANALRSIEQIALVPQLPLGAATRDPDDEASAASFRAARARDAARYGAATVLTLDDRVWLEPQGFWVMGARDPELAIAVDGPSRTIGLDLRNGPALNHVRLSAGTWSSARALAADEHWHADVPVPRSRQAVIIRFEVERGVVPADIDPRSGDHRSLGCWVEVH